MSNAYADHMNGYRNALAIAHECSLEARDSTGSKEAYWISEKERHLERAAFYLAKAKDLNKSICVVDGCLKKAYKRRHCHGHYRRLCEGSTMSSKSPRTPHSVPLAILRECNHGEDCIFWKFAVAGRGYASTNVSGKKKYVHEILCEEQFGKRPTAYHQVAHSCGNGSVGCVNKNHLRWATPKENSEDKNSHGKSNKGERNHFARLTEEQVIQIIKSPKSMKDQELADRFGSFRQTISNIRSGNSWKHVHKMLERQT